MTVRIQAVILVCLEKRQKDVCHVEHAVIMLLALGLHLCTAAVCEMRNPVKGLCCPAAFGIAWLDPHGLCSISGGAASALPSMCVSVLHELLRASPSCESTAAYQYT